MPINTGRQARFTPNAHRFAGAFLMPAELLWSEVGKRRTSVSIGNSSI